MTAPTYSVLADDPRFRAIVSRGPFSPVADASDLLRCWDRQGFRYLDMPLARLLGAVVAVLKNPADALDLARELGAEAEG